MRKLFGTLAILLGALSITITARYGYAGADTPLDGAIAAAVFGTISLCAFLFDGAAVRLWFTGHHKASLFIGLIATAALVVTFGNSLGGIVSRGDRTLAERQNAADSRADDRRELARLTSERAALHPVPATQEAVTAARDALADAEGRRKTECGPNNETRGKHCREREGDEAAKRDALASVLAAKAITDKATNLDASIEATRARLAHVEPVAAVNPLGNALGLILGTGASVVTAWQAAIIAAVFELCLVGVMVIFEVLGHTTKPMASQPFVQPRTISGVAMVEDARPLANATDVARFMLACLPRARGSEAEMHTVYARFCRWCDEQELRPLDKPGFAVAIKDWCARGKIRVRRDGGKVYCLDVKLAS